MSSNNLKEILVFKEFSDINYSSEKIKFINLDVSLISKLLQLF
jgi:hypothetical protein